MRNCALSIIRILLTKTLCSENLSEKEKTMRKELLEHAEVCSFYLCIQLNSFICFCGKSFHYNYVLYKVIRILLSQFKYILRNIYLTMSCYYITFFSMLSLFSHL